MKFLDRNNVAYEKIPILETPPTRVDLKRMLAAQGGNVKKLFNTSGEVYREMKIGEKLKTMTIDDALDLLASNGRLVKRPFVLSDDAALVGFNEEVWKAALT
jgi:Spx/MgsR family transcriptional regulator